MPREHGDVKPAGREGTPAERLDPTGAPADHWRLALGSSSRPPTANVGVQPGDVLAGKYRVERVLGAGGMGVVVAAHHLELDEKVAIKFLLPEALGKPDLLARFERESRAAVKIKSEHVARVIDVGRLDTGAPYMVMEHLEGGDLRSGLHDRGAMKAEQAAEFILQACEAIAEAHALGIVHRDLKPANLFCIRRADGLLSIKVLDFGISKVDASRSSIADLEMTSTGAVIGSPLYMSPEQLKSSKDVDARTDIWSLGVILYELVSNQLPFVADSITQLAIEIATGTPKALRELCPDLPVGFEDVVRRCLTQDRTRRMQNVGELAVALKDYAPKRATGSVERVLRIMEASGSSLPQQPPSGMFKAAYEDTVSVDDLKVGTKSAWGQTGADKKKKRNERMTVLAGAIGLVVVGAVVVTARSLSGIHPVVGAGSGVVAPPAPSTAVSAPAGATAFDTASVAVAPPAPSSVQDVPVAAGTGSASSKPGAAAPARTAPSRASGGAATGAASAAAPQAPAAATPSAAPSCRIVTEYDADGQPHFKKVCN